jgi:hypothetical protein
MFKIITAAALLAPVAHAATDADFARTTPRFCAHVQQRLEGTTRIAENVDHPDYEAFKESKASVDPLRTEQFVDYEDPAAKANPRRISCKVKTADHLNDVYGDGTAKAGGTCQDIHRTMASVVAAGLTAAEIQIPRERIVFEPDDVKVMGSQWVTPFQQVHRAEDGRLHLISKALLVTWTDLRFKLAPDRFRGAHYCHLIAPEYLARLMTGAAVAPAKSDE